MKNISLRIYSFVAAVVLTACAALAQWQHLDGTMMPYDFSVCDSTVPWGNDMKPVFIDYTARHGARFLSSERKVADLRHMLAEADAADSLTVEGKGFLSLLDTVISVTGGEWGALDAIGIMEEKRLGAQIPEVAPELFREGRVEAVSSYVPRVVMTMYEVCHQLACYSTHLDISAQEGRQFNPLLRYFTTDKEYVSFLENGVWKPEYEAYAAQTLPEAPARRLFVAGWGKDWEAERWRGLSLDAYGVLQSLNAAGINGAASTWFSEEEYRSCWEVSNLRHYYQRSDSRLSDLPSRSAVPLLRDIIEHIDNAGRENDGLKAFLRFGHAETVIPLFTLMRLPGCYAPEATREQVASVWKDWEVSPLGANMMIVVLEGADGTKSVAVRHNGRWIEFDGRRIVEWKELRGEWESYMKR